MPVNKKTGKKDVTTMMVEKNTPGPTCLDELSMITNLSAAVRGSFLPTNNFLNETYIFFFVVIFFILGPDSYFSINIVPARAGLSYF
jgi:hypothetical protein